MQAFELWDDSCVPEGEDIKKRHMAPVFQL